MIFCNFPKGKGFYRKQTWKLTLTAASMTLLLVGLILGACSKPNQETNKSIIAAVEVVAENLFTPWAMDFAPDGRMFFTERPGRIRILQKGKLETEPWITLDDVFEELANGLLGLAIDPQFTHNRYLYAAYTYQKSNGDLRDRLVRLREQSNGIGILDRVLAEYGILDGSDHHGGCVKFGPDGKLYWTTGDLSRPPLSQDRSHLAGKILRLNTDGSIPQDNPFPGSLVYSYGHRNSQGLDWQPETGQLYAIEHGPSFHDELNLIEAGGNYGWPKIVGNEENPGMALPILQSGDSETWAPAGATFVNQGPWTGSFIFTGLRGESLYRVFPHPSNSQKVTNLERLLTGKYGRLRAVVEGPDGSIYVGTSNGDGLGKGTPGKEKILRLTLQKHMD